ncbi:MAG: PVC-type heme-binding CxxCH protein [Bacteroidota bacterium]
MNPFPFFGYGALFMLLSACQADSVPPTFYPEVLNAELRLDLVAEQPQIRTPIGIAFDQQDRLLVLESHTHSPPEDYEGPDFDRILRAEDSDADGIPDEWTIFADSLEDGMNLVVHPNGTVYTSTSKGIYAFRDNDLDGYAEEKHSLLRLLKPSNPYDHAGILGIELDPSNTILYTARGNMGSSDWEVEAADGTRLSGYGDGGNVMRMTLEGHQLEEIATGFWNPYNLKFTAKGHLLLTDNDPDSRGPNRLIQLVSGGDYGFKSLYGRQGSHPYDAWNGELPGTLPYLAGIGEAPCDLIDASFTNFGSSFVDHILVNVWEENNIVQVPLQETGGILNGEAEILVQGDSLFHPVAFAVNSKGELYFTDWVIRQYPNHGHGRIWRLGRKTAPKIIAADVQSSQGLGAEDLAEDANSYRSYNAFERARLHHKWRRTGQLDQLFDWLEQEDEELRLGALLALTPVGREIPAEVLQRLIIDPETDIRRMALIYCGQHRRQDMLPALEAALAAGHFSGDLFPSFLATVPLLGDEFIQAYEAKTEAKSNRLPRNLPENYLVGLVRNERLPAASRALAIPYLSAREVPELELITNLQATDNFELKLALLQRLRDYDSPEAAAAIWALASDPEGEVALRNRALLELQYQSASYCMQIAQLLATGQRNVAESVLDYACRCVSNETTTAAVVTGLSLLDEEGLWAQWKHCSEPLGDLPQEEDLLAIAEQDGNVERGALLFTRPNLLCQSCHRVDGWGGVFGPDLSQIGSSKSRQQLANALLYPSREIAPEWVGWFLIDEEGKRHQGRQIDVNYNYALLMNSSGQFDRFPNPQSYGVMERSLMPEGLHYSLRPEEFRDLVAYLASLQ